MLPWAETYAPVVYEWFRAGMDSIPSLIPTLFDVRQSDVPTEYALGVGGVPTDQFDVYEDAGHVANVEMDRWYATSFSHVEKVISYTLKRKDVDDDRLGLVQEALEEIGMAAQIKMEQDAASLFNNAFSSSFTGADGVSLCNASHPYSPDNTGQVQSNTGTAAMSYATVKAARLGMRGWVDSQGNPLSRRGSMLLLPIELEDLALEITNADKKPGGADNDANAIMGFNYMTWDFLTDANNWFLLDPLRARRSLRWYNRVPLDVRIVEQTTTHVKYEFYMRYSYGWTHWSFLYGNNVT